VDVLGICAFDRPAAACLVRDGRVVGAVREDVFSGRLGDRSFPSQAIAYCLRAGKIGPGGVDLVSIASQLDVRVPEAAYPDGGRAVSSFAKKLERWLGRRPTPRDLLRDELDPHVRAESVDVAQAEASAAYFASPFRESAILVIGATETTRWLGRDGSVAALGAFSDDVVASAARTLDETGMDALCVAGSGALDCAERAAARRFRVRPILGGTGARRGGRGARRRAGRGAAREPRDRSARSGG
jgi:predicted NodU family carbamoyl transferase